MQAVRGVRANLRAITRALGRRARACPPLRGRATPTGAPVALPTFRVPNEQDLKNYASGEQVSDWRLTNALEAVWLWSAIEAWVWGQILAFGEAGRGPRWLGKAAATDAGRRLQSVQDSCNGALPSRKERRGSMLMQRIRASGMELQIDDRYDERVNNLYITRNAIAHQHVLGLRTAADDTVSYVPRVMEPQLETWRDAVHRYASAAHHAAHRG